MACVRVFTCDGCGKKAAADTSEWLDLIVHFDNGTGETQIRNLNVCSPMCGARALELAIDP